MRISPISETTYARCIRSSPNVRTLNVPYRVDITDAGCWSVVMGERKKEFATRRQALDHARKMALAVASKFMEKGTPARAVQNMKGWA